MIPTPLMQNKRVPFLEPENYAYKGKEAWIGLEIMLAGLILSVIALTNMSMYLFLFAIIMASIGRMIIYCA